MHFNIEENYTNRYGKLMETLEAKIELNNKLEQLIGQSIEEVYYWEIKYEQPCYEFGLLDSLDYGVSIQTSNGGKFYFIWDNNITSHNIKFVKGEIQREFENPKNVSMHNVSKNKNWEKVIGVKIKNSTSLWSWVSNIGSNKKTFFPQDIKLTFENDLSCFISAVEPLEENNFNYLADNLTICFNKEIANKYIGKENLP